MASSDWWIVWYSNSTGGHAPVTPPATQFAFIRAGNAASARNQVFSMKGSTTVIGSVDGPYPTRNAASTAANTKEKKLQSGTLNLPGGGVLHNVINALNPANWLSGLGGMIGSGIESGFVNFFKDLWNVIVGPVEVVVGILIALFVLAIYFKDDLTAVAGIAKMAAA